MWYLKKLSNLEVASETSDIKVCQEQQLSYVEYEAEVVIEKYPVQSKWGSFGVRACPFFKQYSQPSSSKPEFCSSGVPVPSEDSFAFKCTDLWELQEALKQSWVLLRNTLYENKEIQSLLQISRNIHNLSCHQRANVQTILKEVKQTSFSLGPILIHDSIKNMQSYKWQFLRWTLLCWSHSRYSTVVVNYHQGKRPPVCI